MKSKILKLFSSPTNYRWWFQYQEELGYWVLCFDGHKATIPLVSVRLDNTFYLFHGWDIRERDWAQMCELAVTLQLLVDPFKRGEHMEDAV